jgi:DNA-binding MarR family transcriptional regulator
VVENSYVHELMEAMGKVKKIQMFRLQDSPIQKGDYFMLMNIYMNEEGKGCSLSASQLSRRQRISRPAVSQAVAVLEKKGFVRRETDKDDRRKVWIRLTDEGRKAVTEASARFARFIGEVTERLGEEDTRLLIRLFNRLFCILEEMGRDQMDGKEQRTQTQKEDSV